MKKNTIIDGIAASEHLDSSGESLCIKGMDISSLGGPDSILNWEHGSKEKPSQVVGKVTFARKIFKKEEAKTRREKYFWNKVKKPFVYIKAELFDGLGHSGAQDVAAMLKYKNRDKGEESRLVVGFSIEGGKMDKKGMVVTKSIARDVAITVKPCNKVCDAEILENTKDDKNFLYKNQEYDCEILEKGDLYVNLNSYERFSKSEGKLRSMILADIKKTEKKEHIRIPAKEVKKVKWETNNNMRKTLIAGVMGGAPDSKTGMAALAGEELLGKEKKLKKKAPKQLRKSNKIISNRSIGAEVIPRQDVKTLQRGKTYKSKRTGKTYTGEQLEYMKAKNKGYKGPDFSKQLASGKNDTKGFHVPSVNQGYVYADGPNENTNRSVEDHEATHMVQDKTKKANSPEHQKALNRHMLSDKFFDPKDIESVSDFVNKRYSKDYKYGSDEIVPHILDIIQNPDKRKEYNDQHSHMNSGEFHPKVATQMDRDRVNRLKSGYNAAQEFASSVNPEQLNELATQNQPEIDKKR